MCTIIAVLVSEVLPVLEVKVLSTRLVESGVQRDTFREEKEVDQMRFMLPHNGLSKYGGEVGDNFASPETMDPRFASQLIRTLGRTSSAKYFAWWIWKSISFWVSKVL